ncbi:MULTISPECIES: DNA polymerase III subunit delta [unclassified Coleofasciculus]|uniref:DNA polymerase III subunit delta n=1 Tax=unclassified Coleofasciculus TaxID=2692782 RepID=UPI00187FA7D8|nr:MULTISPECIES: DNA polymerase III subunit delta [unclassified Coleofasciculus]MBE9126569.1 DNA polymerase III subunit delta [Coleofasciculus sp. LEGE 07081]MBE9150003.1 DNA polymerase III subunit delta [Coleofasciculus sp. LEGE 07092]
MPIYLYWGEDDFAMTQAVNELRKSVLDPNWVSFNYDKIPPDQPDTVLQGLNQAMTPPFGMGNRLVWLVETTLCQQCSEHLLAELERTLPAIPQESILLLTAPNRPDGRLKSTKLLQKHAKIQEFPLIPPWKTEQLVEQVKSYSRSNGVKLTPGAAQLLAGAVGNDTRQLFNELEKLRLYAGEAPKPLDESAVTALVTTTTQNSLQLAGAILKGDTAKALALVADLIHKNEPPLRISATLIGQFRTWLWVKLMVSTGEKDHTAIAKAAEVSNPKRIYFLTKEVQHLSLSQLTSTLRVLLELEINLKTGADSLSSLQSKVIQICRLCKS